MIELRSKSEDKSLERVTLEKVDSNDNVLIQGIPNNTEWFDCFNKLNTNLQGIILGNMDFLQFEQYSVFITEKNPYKKYEVYERLLLSTNVVIFKVNSERRWNIVISEEILTIWCISSV